MSPTLGANPHEPASGGPIHDHLVHVVESRLSGTLIPLKFHAHCWYENWQGGDRETYAEALTDAFEHEKGPLGVPDSNPGNPYHPARP